MTREEWLERAALELLALMPPGTVYPPFKISCGWPKMSARGKHVRGECWNVAQSADGVTAQVFISPTLENVELEVLPVVLHEMCHVLTPGAKHKGAFVKLARYVGFEAPWASARVSVGQSLRLVDIARSLGVYPHVMLSPIAKERKQPTRMKKWECSCGVIVRKAGELNAQCLDCAQPFVKDAS